LCNPPLRLGPKRYRPDRGDRPPCRWPAGRRWGRHRPSRTGRNRGRPLRYALYLQPVRRGHPPDRSQKLARTEASDLSVERQKHHVSLLVSPDRVVQPGQRRTLRKRRHVSGGGAIPERMFSGCPACDVIGLPCKLPLQFQQISLLGSKVHCHAQQGFHACRADRLRPQLHHWASGLAAPCAKRLSRGEPVKNHAQSALAWISDVAGFWISGLGGKR
jgi:hypothetical protein